MCGIVGVAGPEGFNAVPVLVEALRRLEYRGYDSAGFAIVTEAGELIVLKDVGRIDDVVRRYSVLSYRGPTGVAHTRWATHGAPSRVNAHPHVDCHGRIAVVHNGIISNYSELRGWLEGRGHKFASETDSEVIAHLFEEALSSGLNGVDALRWVVGKLRGSYAFALVHSGEPHRVYFARNVSPLIVGLAGTFNMVSSDIPSLLPYTRKVIILEDGEYGYIEPSKVYLEKGGKLVDTARRLRVVSWTPEAAEKGGYPHFMLKEIMEQPRAVYETLRGLESDPALVEAAKLVVAARRVYITGAGTSYHAGLVFAYYAARLAKLPVVPFIASEYKWVLEPVGENDVLIAVSQSGETIDTLMAVREARRRGARVVAVSNVVGSAIPRESDVTIYTRAGPEIGVAATKTYLTQVAALAALAIRVAELEGLNVDTARNELWGEAHRAVELGLRRSSEVSALARRLRSAKSMYILGRMLGAILAYEAALKVKEVSYIHAEAYPAGESKHGPISLVEPGFPVVFIAVPPLEVAEKLRSNVEEMKSRGAETIAFAINCVGDLGADFTVSVNAPCSEVLAPFAIAPLFQMLAYKLAVYRGLDPDKPRNLAKTVTVE